jgi:hypothetical protein
MLYIHVHADYFSLVDDVLLLVSLSLAYSQGDLASVSVILRGT